MRKILEKLFRRTFAQVRQEVAAECAEDKLDALRCVAEERQAEVEAAKFAQAQAPADAPKDEGFGQGYAYGYNCGKAIGLATVARGLLPVESFKALIESKSLDSVDGQILVGRMVEEVMQTYGQAIELGEIIKATLADPIRIRWAYNKATGGFGDFSPLRFYAACGEAAGIAEEALK